MIIQIIFGKIPLHLQACVNSVIDYAMVNGLQYKQITSYKDYFEEPIFNSKLSQFLWYRHVSDFVRTKLLSIEARTLYIDWDVFLYPDFKITVPEKLAFGKDPIDCILYNGDELEPFNHIHNLIEKPSFNPTYNLSNILRGYVKKNLTNTFEGHYLHLDNCRFKMSLDCWL